MLNILELFHTLRPNTLKKLATRPCPHCQGRCYHTHTFTEADKTIQAWRCDECMATHIHTLPKDEQAQKP